MNLTQSNWTKEELRSEIARLLETPVSNVTDKALFFGDIGISSINVIIVLLFIEETFAMEISDEEAENLSTFGNVIEFLQKREMIAK